MATTSELQKQIEQFSVDIGLTRQFVQGAPTETVALGGVDTPSIRKLVADFHLREADLLRQAELYAQNARQEADKAQSAISELHALYVTATTLPHTEQGQAHYEPSTGQLSLSIPRGEPGPPGTVPALDCVDGGRAHQDQLTTLDGGTACLPM